MKPNNGCRLCMVPTASIKRMQGIKSAVAKQLIRKTKEFAEQRGCYMPVILSEAQGCMTLLSGAATFEASLEQKVPEIPAVVVQTGGGADELLFSLQSAELTAPPDTMYISDAVIRLIDEFAVPRRAIAGSLGKSAAWVSRAEGLRRLGPAARGLVSDGFISPRAAQDIARLPASVQVQFAVSAGNEFLSKDDIAFLVGRYLDSNTGAEERDRIVNSPKRALPQIRRRRNMRGAGQTISAQLTCAVAGCIDNVSFLLNFLDRNDAGHITVNTSDAAALVCALYALAVRLQPMVCPGGSEALSNG